MQNDRRRLRILFLCTGNSCRGQMAEGWTRILKGDVIEPFSAGVEVKGLDPKAVEVMLAEGIDISAVRPTRRRSAAYPGGIPYSV